jgi:hypothetical protein
MNQAKYTTELITDLFILIRDIDAPDCPSVTNDADRVVRDIHLNVADLFHRHVYYHDSMGNIDELRQQKGRFIGFGPCSEQQRRMLTEYLGVGNATETQSQ